jgi:hypothetical protein
MRRLVLATCLLACAAPAARGEPSPAAWRTWLIPAANAVRPSAPPADAETAAELRTLHALAERRDARARATVAYWDSGSPSYRWNEIAVDEMLRRGVPTPVAGRHMALLHAAIYDAMIATWDAKQAYGRARPSARDPALATLVAAPPSPSYPAEHAAAAAAAAEVLAYVFADRADFFHAQADEAAQSRVLAGVQYPSDVAAGLALGRAIGQRAVARGKTDGSDAKWTGAVPTEPDKWRGTSPVLPLAGTWTTWVLRKPDELRPPPPPAPGSAQLVAELAELTKVQRTPGMLSAAWFWEWGAGGFRGFQFWNDQASRKTVEYRMESSPPHAARVYALESIAFHDATVACWDAKYAYWAPRPFMVDAGFKALFPAPNHPSYPAAHGCLSTAAGTVLARLFPHHAQSLQALSDQAAEARAWAGIHFRSDIDAGKALGRAVAAKVLAAVEMDLR